MRSGVPTSNLTCNSLTCRWRALDSADGSEDTTSTQRKRSHRDDTDIVYARYNPAASAGDRQPIGKTVWAAAAAETLGAAEMSVTDGAVVLPHHEKIGRSKSHNHHRLKSIFSATWKWAHSNVPRDEQVRTGSI